MKTDVAYILWEFPAISETFISNEIRALDQNHGLNIRIFSNKKANPEKIHEETKIYLQATDYLPSLISLPHVAALFYFLFLRPIKFFGIFLKIISMVPFNTPNRIPYFVAQSSFCLIKAFNISKKIMSNKPTHLHSHYAESAAYMTMMVSFLTDIPYSFTMHAHDIFINKNKKLIVYLIKNSKFAVTISKFNRKYLVNLDPSVRDKIHIIHCGIDLDRFNPERKNQKNPFQVLTVARLVKTKGVHKVIQALASLAGKEEVIYKVIGSGPEAENLHNLVKKKNLSKQVVLMGAQVSQVVLDELNASDVFVLHCLRGDDGNMDGIPVALMEAMAMKLPVVSTKLSGIPELIKDGAGLIGEPEDDEALIANLEKIMSMPESERRKMGEIGRNIIEREFNLETETKKLKSLFLGSHAKN